MHLSIDEIFDGFSNLHIAVIGDVMLDNYYWGKVSRMSPEAPVPIVAIEKKENRPGGAANVALNCAALGAKVSLLSILGDDDDGKILQNLLQQQSLDTQYLRKSADRTTTSKTRILSRNQQMLRMDHEMIDELTTQDEHAFIDICLRFLQIQTPDIVIIQDYNKGLLKENVITKILNHCQHLKIPVAVDPKHKNFFEYKNVQLFKPNLAEVKEALQLHVELNDISDLDQIHQRLLDQLKHKISLVTLSSQGVYFNSGSQSEWLPSHFRNIADVSGAGDTVIAVAAMVLALTNDAKMMAEYSNVAGGLVCETLGVAPIHKEQFKQEIKKIFSNTNN